MDECMYVDNSVVLQYRVKKTPRSLKKKKKHRGRHITVSRTHVPLIATTRREQTTEPRQIDHLQQHRRPDHFCLVAYVYTPSGAMLLLVCYAMRCACARDQPYVPRSNNHSISIFSDLNGSSIIRGLVVSGLFYA